MRSLATWHQPGIILSPIWHHDDMVEASIERTMVSGYLLEDTLPRNRVYEKARTPTQLLLFVCLNDLKMIGPLLFFFLWQKNELVQFVKDILDSRFGPCVVSSAHQAGEYLSL